MKLTIAVLGDVLKLSPIVNLDFTFESKFSMPNVNSGFDLPNLKIYHGTNNTKIITGNKVINLTKPISEYMIHQVRRKSDNDVLGIYGSTDSIHFEEPDCANLDVSIYYNVARKLITVDENACDYIIVIDNIINDTTNNGIINYFLEKNIKDKVVVTANPNYKAPVSCWVEKLKC